MIIEKLNKYHLKDNFDCGNEILNTFLKKYALQNQNRYFVGTTYVSTKANQVIGYITIAASSIKQTDIKTKKPYKELPILKIARLAVDKDHHKKGIGKELLKFALFKALYMQENFGCIGVAVDAKEEAKTFYEKFGFIEITPIEKTLTIPLFLSIKTIKKAIS
ncbi:MAG: GNAT family N-acetyltransferase [Epsilonproteobacteria bacterium]|nr:GNAT family N-acetyltransferase [Campylobacterota bacterium]